jgi:hypothetical protein
MTDSDRRELLNVIRQFKPPDISDLDAALNCIASHAETIRELTNARRELQDALFDIGKKAAILAERSLPSEPRPI